MQRFWAAICATTSVRDLGDYGAWTSERLQRLRRQTDALHAVPPRSGIWMPTCVPALPRRNDAAHSAPGNRNFLAEIVERQLESRLGYLLVNSALEVAPRSGYCRRCGDAPGVNWKPFSGDAWMQASVTAAYIARGCKGWRSAAADHSDGAARSRPRSSTWAVLGVATARHSAFSERPTRKSKPSARTSNTLQGEHPR